MNLSRSFLIFLILNRFLIYYTNIYFQLTIENGLKPGIQSECLSCFFSLYFFTMQISLIKKYKKNNSDKHNNAINTASTIYTTEELLIFSIYADKTQSFEMAGN